ncbi:hypothetical protein [Hydrogenophaga sp.]|jgi:hypothetical protein|uniref:hypothetical protein n=2 Tax=unclassified Hydrogenophaga TaxID=2610897 RepID=UPI001179F057
MLTSETSHPPRPARRPRVARMATVPALLPPQLVERPPTPALVGSRGDEVTTGKRLHYADVLATSSTPVAR